LEPIAAESDEVLLNFCVSASHFWPLTLFPSPEAIARLPAFGENSARKHHFDFPVLL
jgi:hypothetical protein